MRGPEPLPLPLSVEERTDQIVEEFARLEGWEDIYRRIVAMGEELPPMPPPLRTEENRIGGCQSSLWVAARLENGRLRFYADSDAKITRGLAAVVLRVVQDQPPEAVSRASFDFLDTIGLRSGLSPSRAVGLASIINRIQELSHSPMVPSAGDKG